MLRLVLPRLPAGLPGWAAGTARRLHAATRTCAPPPPPARPLVVQKYGGTSLGTSSKLEKVLDIVGKQHRDANVVAVVSALSAETKAEGSTSRLLAAADAAVGGGVFQHYLEAIEDTHLDVIFDMVWAGGRVGEGGGGGWLVDDGTVAFHCGQRPRISSSRAGEALPMGPRLRVKGLCSGCGRRLSLAPELGRPAHQGQAASFAAAPKSIISSHAPVWPIPQ